MRDVKLIGVLIAGAIFWLCGFYGRHSACQVDLQQHAPQGTPKRQLCDFYGYSKDLPLRSLRSLRETVWTSSDPRVLFQERSSRSTDPNFEPSGDELPNDAKHILRIQESEADITPPELLPLGGYTAREGKTMDPGGEHLFARCVIFHYGDLLVAMVSAEMLTIPDSLRIEVEKRIPSGVQLFLAATHTHSAPDSQLLNDHMTFSVPGIATFHHRWLEWYADQIAACITAALGADSTPVTKLQAVQFEEHLNRGRRPGADPEELATVLQGWFATVKRAKLRDIFLTYAAHPVFYGPENNQTSGDWPGEVSRRIESRQPGFVFPVLMAAIGDVSPKASGKTPKDRIDNFSGRIVSDLSKRTPIADTVWKARDAEWKIRIAEEPIILDPPTPSPAFILDYKVPAQLAQIMVQQFVPNSATILGFRLGSMAILGVPGEPTSHLGRRIRAAGRKLGFKSVLVVSHVNGWIGYILDAKDYAQGGYEASLSFNGPDEGDHVVSAAIDTLQDLARKP